MMKDYLVGIHPRNFEIALTSKKVKSIYVIWNFNSFDDEGFTDKEFELMGIDITERVIAEKELLASHDELTSLYEELAASEQELRENYHELALNEEQIRKNEQRYSLVVETANIGIWDWDIVNNKRFYSEKWYEIFGFDPDEDMDTVLMVAEPYSDIYIKYLSAQVDYYNGDMARYNNDMIMFNVTQAAFAAWFNREYMPLQDNSILV
jgi:PAS domain-containing protein